MSAETSTATAPTAVTRIRWGVGAITLAVTVALPLALWLVVDPIAGHRLEAVSGGATQQIGMAAVLIGGLIPAAVGLGIAAALHRFTTRGRLIWLIVAPAALILSLLTPLGGTTTGTIAVLLAMHLAVGIPVIIGGLRLPAKA